MHKTYQNSVTSTLNISTNVGNFFISTFIKKKISIHTYGTLVYPDSYERSCIKTKNVHYIHLFVLDNHTPVIIATHVLFVVFKMVSYMNMALPALL